MDLLHETRAMDVEHGPQVDQLERYLGFTAYVVVNSEDVNGRQIIRGDGRPVYTPPNISESFIDEPMLPIEDFSK